MTEASQLVSKTHIATFSIETLVQEYGDYMHVIDPTVPQYSGTFQLPIPWESIEETEGFYRFVQNQHPQPSLCMLFQEGRCRMHQQCNQVHADPAMVNVVRDNYRNGGRATCCRFHMDPYYRNDLSLKQSPALVMVTFAGAHLEIPLERTEKTLYLDKLLSQALSAMLPKAFFQMSYVCRLHQKRKCGYSSQCGHVHLCREYWLQLFSIYPWLSYEPDPSNRNMRMEGFPNLFDDGFEGGHMNQGPIHIDQNIDDTFGSYDPAYEPSQPTEEGWYGDDGGYYRGGGGGYGSRAGNYNTYGGNPRGGRNQFYGPPDELLFSRTTGGPGYQMTIRGTGLGPSSRMGGPGRGGGVPGMGGFGRQGSGSMARSGYGMPLSDLESESQPLTFDEYGGGGGYENEYGGGGGGFGYGGTEYGDYGSSTLASHSGGGGGAYFESTLDMEHSKPPTSISSEATSFKNSISMATSTSSPPSIANAFGVGIVPSDPTFFLDNLDNLEVTEIIVTPELEVAEVIPSNRSTGFLTALAATTSAAATAALRKPAFSAAPSTPPAPPAASVPDPSASAVTESLRLMGLIE